jgi:hypothetical protein
LHALIVAGPSGAGKSSLLHELYAGRLAWDVRRHLPPEAETWPLVYCNHPEQWQGFVADGNLAPQTVGLVVHHDITIHWRKHRQELARDPFWQVLERCERVTLVVMRPSSGRLLQQWSRAHLGMRPWKVRARKLLAVSAGRLLRGLRLLRVSKHPRVPGGRRYPRPVRFLKHVDRKLRGYRMRPTWHFDFYRQHGAVERMMRCWDDMIAAKTAALSVTRVELSPDPVSQIGKAFGWRISRVGVGSSQLEADEHGHLAAAPSA